MSNEPSDLMTGYEEIGKHLQMTARAAKHLAETTDLPVFRLKTRTVRARRSTLNAWLAEQEAAARKAPAVDPAPAAPEDPKGEARRGRA